MILITGGAGFIGSHLAEALVERGESVRVLDDLSSGHLANLASVEKHIDFRRGSIQDVAVVRDALQGVRWVFHEAAVPSVTRSVEEPLPVHDVNSTGTLVVLEEAARAQVERLVFAGSSAVYGDRVGQAAAREDMREWPQSPYAVQKTMGEQYCRSFAHTHGLHTVTLRYFNVFGPRQDPSSPYSGVISIFCDRMLRGEAPTIYGDGLQTRDFVYVQDVVNANLLAAAADVPAGSTFNIAGGGTIDLLTLYRTLAQAFDFSHPPVLGAPRAGDIRHSGADISAARKALGYQPGTDLATGIQQTVAWYRERVEQQPRKG